MAVKAIPEGYHSVTPYLTVQGAATLLDFLKQAFAATELHRMTRPDGTVGHAEVRIVLPTCGGLGSPVDQPPASAHQSSPATSSMLLAQRRRRRSWYTPTTAPRIRGVGDWRVSGIGA